MPEARSVIPLTGSERAPLRGARAIGPVPPARRFAVTLFLRSRTGGELPSIQSLAAKLPHERPCVPRAEFAAEHGAAIADVRAIEDFAHGHGLDVSAVNLMRRSVVLNGTAGAFSRAFNVRLQRFRHSGGIYRGRTGPVHLPPELTEKVQGVFGLDNRPQAKPHFRLKRGPGGKLAARAAGEGFTPPELARLYNFPPALNGQGQTIGIIELGGGYRLADLKTYFAGLGIASPAISAVSVDGGHNRPTGSPDGPDGEVMLDIEVAGAVANGARLVVYFAPNTDRGFLDAITTAIHDPIRKPSIISISWGGPESAWTAQALHAFNQAFQAAGLLGVTVCAAAGDDGSADGGGDGHQHVDFPASSPYVLACGGTRVTASGGNIAQETVWNDGAQGGATGGGVSDAFDLPTWQASAHVPHSANPDKRVGRGVPDVSGDADPVSGYRVRVDGVDTVIGGTSAVAPLWAGLLALINQSLGHPVGYLNPPLYGKAGSGGALRDIIQGNNGAYKAQTGWDACTGWGSPNGAKLLQNLQPASKAPRPKKKAVAKPPKPAGKSTPLAEAPKNP